MTNYFLASYERENGPSAGLVIGERIHDLASLSGRGDFGTTLGILRDWKRNEAVLEDLASSCNPHAGVPLAQARLLAPVLYPSAVYCAGANYADHVAAMERRLGLPPGPDPRADGGRPFHFLKASRCCVGQGAEVRAPSPQLDWEAELVVVIGAPARNVSADDALNYVAGYMAGNDLSARDVGFRANTPKQSVFHHSFIDHKSFENSAPVGPWIAPAAQVGDPGSLSIRTWVNDVLRQDGNSGTMIFTVHEQIAYLSTITTLNPGDIIMTGTPAGAGAETGEFMRPGDKVTVEIEKIGRLETTIV